MDLHSFVDAPGSRPRLRRWRVLATSLAVGVGVFALVADRFVATGNVASRTGSGALATLEAVPGYDAPGVDADADGISDSIEAQFGASLLGGDSDSDGVTDQLEILFGTEPFDPTKKPSVAQLASPRTRVLAYVESGMLHLVPMVYVPGGNLSQITAPLALMYIPDLYGQGPAALDLTSFVLTGVSAQSSPPSGGAIYSSDNWFPLSLVGLFTSFDGYAQFTVAFSCLVGTQKVTDVALFSTTAQGDLSSTTLAYMGVPAGAAPSGAFRPLQPVTLPPGFVADKACIVQNAVVGVEPPGVLVLQTTSAACEPFTAGFCSTGPCEAQVGRVLRTIDPLLLAGN